MKPNRLLSRESMPQRTVFLKAQTVSLPLQHSNDSQINLHLHDEEEKFILDMEQQDLPWGDFLPYLDRGVPDGLSVTPVSCWFQLTSTLGKVVYYSASMTASYSASHLRIHFLMSVSNCHFTRLYLNIFKRGSGCIKMIAYKLRESPITTLDTTFWKCFEIFSLTG